MISKYVSIRSKARYSPGSFLYKYQKQIMEQMLKNQNNHLKEVVQMVGRQSGKRAHQLRFIESIAEGMGDASQNIRGISSRRIRVHEESALKSESEKTYDAFRKALIEHQLRQLEIGMVELNGDVFSLSADPGV